MIYITGDLHRHFERLNNPLLSKDDMIIILGDAGINYYLDERDEKLKDELNKQGIKLFCIRGNHEERPENISSYQEKEMFNGRVLIEEKYPNLIFAKDGEEYLIDGKKVLVIGGAYSIDKPLRIMYGYGWFKDEQLTENEMDEIFKKVSDKHYDIILSHTTPYKYEPREAFSPFIEQKWVDKKMEHFLDKIEENVDYDKWYCGHYHIDKWIDKIRFMYGDIDQFTKELDYKYRGVL